MPENQRHAIAAFAILFVAGSSACVLTITDSTDSGSATTAPVTDGGTDSTAAGTSGSTEAPTGSTPTEATTATTTDATSEGGSTAAATTGGDTGQTAACGWVADQHIYACGGVGEDPDGLVPIDCEAPPVADAPCDGDQGPIADPGCCADDVNAYCYQGKLIVTDCS